MKKRLCVFVSVLLLAVGMIFAVQPTSIALSDDDADVIHMFICYGQSWSVGYDAAAITTEARYDNLMLDTGIKNNPLSDLSVTATAFVPAVEFSGKNSDTASYKQTTGETPVSAQMNMVKQLMEDEDGLDMTVVSYPLLGTAPGMGSKTLAQLSKGTDYYNRLVAQVQQAHMIATVMDKRLVVEAFSWVQGSLGSGLKGTYAANLEQLRLDIDTDVKAITGQTEDVKCITWQSYIYNKNLRAKQVYNQYVGAAETYPHIICAGATYHLDNVRAANLHFTSESQDWLGAYFGIAYKRTILDGEKFEPLKPIAANTRGNELLVKFHVPYGSLVFDGDYFADAANEVPNEGFRLYAADGTEKTITDVSITSSDTVKIVCADAVENTDRLTYGDISTDAYQWVNNNRGHLRDTQGDSIQYKSGNLNDNHTVLPLHNWCVLFDKTIDELGHFHEWSEPTPDVTDPDVHSRTCTCGMAESAPHSFDDGVGTRDGKVYTCGECGYFYIDKTFVFVPGDVDGNGKVNVRDIACLQRYLNGWEVDINIDACDANGDGTVNNRDIALLQQHLNGWDVELK